MTPIEPTGSKRLSERIMPPSSWWASSIRHILYGLTIIRQDGLAYFFQRLYQYSSWQVKTIVQSINLKIKTHGNSKYIHIEDIQYAPQPQPHMAMVDIIICVQGLLTNIRQCLSAVVENTLLPYSLILVDNGNTDVIQRYLMDFSNEHRCILMRNEQALAYPLAANQAIRQSNQDFVILLDSNTMVTSGWLDRMIACAQTNPKIGFVSPLSNYATQQSIPVLDLNIEIASHALQPNIPYTQFGDLVASYSNRLYPAMKYLNSFCFMMRRQVIDQIGLLGQVNPITASDAAQDFFQRVSKAGWQITLADDTYVYHQSANGYSDERSQNHEIRPTYIELQNREEPSLSPTITDYHDTLVLQGISSHIHHIIERETLLQQGRKCYSNRRVLFVSPIRVLGGGANLIILAAEAMQRMGVDAQILNLHVHRSWFERNYPDLKLPIVFADIKDIPQLSVNYDALVATSNPTVSWIAPASLKRSDLVMGYYIQDYEPYFYPQASHEYRKATASYTLVPDLIRMVTTPWISEQINLHHQTGSNIVGAHMNVDMFQPRPRSDLIRPNRPLRIAAMIRPATPRRNPKMTMAILHQASSMYHSKVEFQLFGCDPTDPGFASLDYNFPWQIAGQLRPSQMATLLNEADIFVDFSEFQAFGLTALESMASGLAVIVPDNGGTGIYAKHEENCLAVDTHDQSASFKALQRLIEDDALRQKLQISAIPTAAQFFPELPAINILKTLFPEDQ